MKEGVDRIRNISTSLRVFSRADTVHQVPFDIHEGIDSTLMILGHRLKAKPNQQKIQVIKDYGSLPLVEGYPGQINQVFMNILGNAIDALEENSQSMPVIQIWTEVTEDDWVKIHIADNGSGMTEEIRSRLFDPFFTTKSVGKGTGLGLSISTQIVTERHHGKLYCHSTIGQGTEFVTEISVRSAVQAVAC